MNLTSKFRKDYRLRGKPPTRSSCLDKACCFLRIIIMHSHKNGKKSPTFDSPFSESQDCLIFCPKMSKEEKKWPHDRKIESYHDQISSLPPLLHVDIWTLRGVLGIHSIQAINKQSRARPCKAIHLWPVEKQQAQQCSLKKRVLTARPLRGHQERQLCSYLGTKEGKASRWAMQFQLE